MNRVPLLLPQLDLHLADNSTNVDDFFAEGTLEKAMSSFYRLEANQLVKKPLIL